MCDRDWQIEVDRSTPDEWAQMIDLFSDANLYQTWSYGAVRWGRRNLSHLVLKRGGEVFGMAQLRIVRPPIVKLGMAYLRWGPLCELRGRPLDPEVVISMARALEDEYASQRRLVLRVLPNALSCSPRAALYQSAFSGFKREPLTSANTYRTFILDLGPPLEELRRSLDAKWRNKLTQAEKKGLRVVAGNGTDEYRTFCRMYYEMRKRKTFESTVDVDEFARIQEDLPESHRMQILICEDRAVPVAGLVASAMGDSAVYVLGATSNDGLNAKGAYLLQWNLIKWLKENGFKWYDLGGIDPERNPGVYQFKRGLSGTDVFQMNPLVACDSVVSSGMVKVGVALQRAVRRCKNALHFARQVKPQASRD
jgi:lipid II:glycine glycyltransferase (peptidoglycan interpeptide bridge formation enzyme)